jgi:hypothetical protein
MKIHLDKCLGRQKHCVWFVPQSGKLCLPQHTRKTYLHVSARETVSLATLNKWVSFCVLPFPQHFSMKDHLE